MKDTIKSLLESTITPNVNILEKNRIAFGKLSKFNESECTAFIPAKVIVNKSSSGKYVIEFSGNIERLMRDQEIEITEAMDIVSNYNNIPIEECILLLDESSISILDINKVIELNPQFIIATK